MMLEFTFAVCVPPVDKEELRLPSPDSQTSQPSRTSSRQSLRGGLRLGQKGKKRSTRKLKTKEDTLGDFLFDTEGSESL